MRASFCTSLCLILEICMEHSLKKTPCLLSFTRSGPFKHYLKTFLIIIMKVSWSWSRSFDFSRDTTFDQFEIQNTNKIICDRFIRFRSVHELSAVSPKGESYIRPQECEGQIKQKQAAICFNKLCGSIHLTPTTLKEKRSVDATRNTWMRLSYTSNTTNFISILYCNIMFSVITNIYNKKNQKNYLNGFGFHTFTIWHICL